MLLTAGNATFWDAPIGPPAALSVTCIRHRFHAAADHGEQLRVLVKERQHRSPHQAAPTEDVMLVTDPRRTTTGERELEGSAAHLLRLCLDLQLDALMLTLGASAVDPAPETPTAAEAPGVPWRRWIGEDVDLACTLAAAALAGKAALPPTLGSDLSHAVPVTTIDDLVARYTSMVGLLDDLARRTEGSTRPQGLDEARAHCEARLAELRSHKLVTTPPAGLDLRSERQFLPGELLG
jgi:hypothetical protein